MLLKLSFGNFNVSSSKYAIILSPPGSLVPYQTDLIAPAAPAPLSAFVFASLQVLRACLVQTICLRAPGQDLFSVNFHSRYRSASFRAFECCRLTSCFFLIFFPFFLIRRMYYFYAIVNILQVLHQIPAFTLLCPDVRNLYLPSE